MHEKPGFSRSESEEALEHFETRTHERTRTGKASSRLQKYPDLGTALYENEVVRGYPKIPRTLVLIEGVPRYFDGEFSVEEKMGETTKK